MEKRSVQPTEQCGRPRNIHEALSPYFNSGSQAERLSGGRIHHTYRIFDSEKRAILKVRTRNWAMVPSKTLVPEDIQYEFKALSLYSHYFPDVFPKPLAFFEEFSAILMSDVLEHGKLLSERINDQSVTPEDFYCLGAVIGKVHNTTGQLPVYIKGNEKDEKTYQRVLEDILGRFDNPTLNNLIITLHMQPRQLVLGDLQATNIGLLDDGSIKLFDLERSHSGNQMLEVGYFVGDLVARLFDRPEDLKQALSSFLEGYGQFNSTDIESSLLKKIVLGVLLYTVDNGTHKFSTDEKDITNRATALLKVEPLSWNSMVDLLTGNQQEDTGRRDQWSHRNLHRYHESNENIFKPQVQPFTENQLQHAFSSITGTSLEKQLSLQNIMHRNREILERNNTVGVILDGRNGWIGDTVEASRVLSPLISSGKNIVIFTPHPDLFSGNPYENVKIVTLPSNMESKPSYPPTGDLLGILASEGEIPFLFPTQANWPMLVELEKDRTTDAVVIKDYDALKKQVEFIFEPDAPDDRTPIRGAKDAWKRLGFHQLHALQAVSHIIGIPDSSDWTTFPPAFIFPDNESEKLGEEAFRQLNLQEDTIPLLIHLGTAKGLALKRSKHVSVTALGEIHNLLNTVLPDNIKKKLKLIYYTHDEYEDVIIEDFVYHAQEKGLSVQQLTPQPGWTLGAMSSLIKRLGNRNGIVLGPDSMIAGHLAPALGTHSIVLGNRVFNPDFYSPTNGSLVILPPNQRETAREINPEDICFAIEEICKQIMQ